MRTFIFLFSTLLMSVACSNPLGAPDEIYGAWGGVSWKADGKSASFDASAVQFRFERDKTYSAVYGDQNEQGAFKIDGRKLYTTADGQMQKMVKILRLDSDTLEIEMNRSGVRENLILARKK